MLEYKENYLEQYPVKNAHIEFIYKEIVYVIDKDVTLEDGTGIVHIAPAYGEDDSLVSKQNGLAFVNLVDKAGKFVEEVEPWAGKFVKKC